MAHGQPPEPEKSDRRTHHQPRASFGHGAESEKPIYTVLWPGFPHAGARLFHPFRPVLAYRRRHRDKCEFFSILWPGILKCSAGKPSGGNFWQPSLILSDNYYKFAYLVQKVNA